MKRALLIFGAVVGCVLMFGPVLGILGTVFGMQQAFHILGGSGVRDPENLSAAIGTTLISTMIGILAFPIGAALFILCLVGLYRLRVAKPPPLPPSLP